MYMRLDWNYCNYFIVYSKLTTDEDLRIDPDLGL